MPVDEERKAEEWQTQAHNDVLSLIKVSPSKRHGAQLRH
jgi:hypothetical protein